MSSFRQAPLIGRRALAVVIGLAVVVGLVVVFSGSLTRSTDTGSRAQAAQADVLARTLVLEETKAEREFIETPEFARWQGRALGYGEPDEIRFALPDDAPSPAPIPPIGPQQTAEPMTPFDAWMELLFGA